MGLLRWAAIIGTGGLAPVKGTAPRERTAKAAEKQVRLQKEMLSGGQSRAVRRRKVAARSPSGPQYDVTCPKCSTAQSAPAGQHFCPMCGFPIEVTAPSARGQDVSETPAVRAAAAAAQARAEALAAGATEAEGEAVAKQAAQDCYASTDTKWAWRSTEGLAQDIARSNATIARIRAERAHSELAEGVSTELARLAELHSQGALTDDEFAAAKARILRS